MIDYSFPTNKARSKKGILNVLNLPMLGRVCGILIWTEAFMFLISALVSVGYGESCYRYFVIAMFINLLLGSGLVYYGRNASSQLSRHDAYFIVPVIWILFTLFGMLPFYLSGQIPSITDAFFETMSGFTTTGATVLDHIEEMSHGMLFWRSLTQWIGGVGIVFFTIAILPVFGSNNMQLFSAEATGVTHNKLHPKITVMAKWIMAIYVSLTLVETLLLVIGGMSFFDAVCHAFATTATGGFSTKQDSISHWDSPFIEYVIAIFMILSGINFSLYYLFIVGKCKKFFQDRELHWFLISLIGLTLIITIALIFKNDYGIEYAFRKSLFQVATVHTSCGFASDDFNFWPQFTWILLLFAMISGGCTGSTSGGIKNMRMLISFHNIKNEFKRLLHPRAMLQVKIDKHLVAPSVVEAVHTFIIFYFLCIFVGTLLLMIFGVDMIESLSTVISSLGNVGPGLGIYGPAFSWATLPDVAKWILSFLMLIGRLELFGILLLFTPFFWED
ncbi:MAG: TrkH family potassium uptake protein [Bacteroidales bacterium]